MVDSGNANRGGSGRSGGLLLAGGPKAPWNWADLGKDAPASFHWRRAVPAPGPLGVEAAAEAARNGLLHNCVVAYPFPGCPPARPRWALLSGRAVLAPPGAGGEPRSESERLRWVAAHLELLLGLDLAPGPANAAAAGREPHNRARTSVYYPSSSGRRVEVLQLVGTRPRAAVAALGNRLWPHGSE